MSELKSKLNIQVFPAGTSHVDIASGKADCLARTTDVIDVWYADSEMTGDDDGTRYGKTADTGVDVEVIDAADSEYEYRTGEEWYAIELDPDEDEIPERISARQ